MATPIEDFLITLGFDTSKVKSQIEKLNTDLNKLAVSIDAKRVKHGLATQKKIATEEIKTAKATAKEILKLDKETAKQRQRIYADSAPKPIVVPSSKPSNPKGSTGGSRGGGGTSPITSSTRKQAALRQLRNQIAEYERSVGGPSNASNRYKYYERGNASIAKIQAYTEELRGKNTDTRNRMKAEGSLKSFDSASSSKAEMDMLKASNAIEVLRVQMQKLGIATKDLDKNLIDSKDVNSMKKLAEQTRQQIRLHKEQNKLLPKAPKPTKVPVDKRPTSAYINQLMNNYRVGAVGKYDPATQRLLQQQAMGQSSQGASRAYLNAAGDIQKYQRLDPNKVQSALSSGSVIEIRAAQKELARMNSELERTRRHAIGAQAAFSSMHDSTRNMVREYASIYALFAGTGFINQIGQDFEGLNSAMLAATGNTSDAKDQMQFMIDLSKRLGLNVKEISDQYIKFKFAASGKLNTEQIETLFTNTSELGTVLGLSQERMKLTFTSMSQMMSKTTVMSEELKGQMSESFPGAVQIFAKAMNVSEKELFKMMEQGKLLSAEVLPKVAAVMKDMANAGGALEAKMNSARVAQGQFTTAMQLSADKIFNSGFGKGIADLFRTMTDSMEDNGATLEQLGGLYEKFFKAMTYVVKYATSLFAALVRTLDFFTDHPAITSIGLITGALYLATKAAGGLGKALMIAFKGPMAVITMFLGLMQEVFAIFDENLIGIGENDKASAEDRKIAAAQFRASAGMGTESDAKLLGGLSQDRINLAMANNGGVGGMFGKGINAVQNFTKSNEEQWATNKEFQQGKKDSQGWFSVYEKLMKMPATVIFNITGSNSDEILDKVSNRLDSHYDMKAAPTR